MNKEVFYKIPFKCDKISLDLVVSEYLISKRAGVYKLTGYLSSEYTKAPESHLYTYFMCTNMEQTEEDIQPGPIYISGKVAKLKNFTTLNNGKQILPIVVRHRSRDGHTSILHAVLNDKEARFAAASDIMSGAHVDLEGYLQARYNTVEVVVQAMSLRGKDGEVVWATNSET